MIPIPSSGSQTDALLDKSLELTKAGCDAENEQLLRGAVKRFPTDAELVFRLGVATCDQHPHESKRHLRRAVGLTPDDPGILTRGASLMFALGDMKTAREWAERARTRAPDGFPLLIPLVHLIGKLAEGQGSFEAADRALKLAFREEPETVEHARVLAQFYVRRGRLQEAFEVVAAALTIHEHDAWLLRLKGDLESRLFP